MAGLDAVPTFPFKGLKDLYPGLQQGDPVLWTAKTKHGKSTIAQVVAENWYKRSFYVVSVEKETSPEIFAARRRARLIGLPTKVSMGWTLNNGKRLPPMYEGHPEWAKVYKAYREKLAEEFGGSKGVFVHLNGPKYTDMKNVDAALAEHAERARSMGLEMVVVVDYLQKADWRAFHRDERVGLAQVASKYKNIIQNLDCYAVIFAQETHDTITGERYPLGSYEAQRVFQAHLSLVRKKAEQGAQMPVANKKREPLTNALGQPRYWCRGLQNELHRDAKIEVIVANDGSPGVAHVKVENNLYMVYDDDEKPREYETLLGP
jgi:hypothetical protein